MRLCDPPLAAGQPTAWPEATNVSPNDEVRGAPRSRMAWAAMPPNRARASSPSKARRASVGAGHRAFNPNRVRVIGWRGTRSSGPRMEPVRSSQWSTKGPTSRRQARPSSAPRPSTVASSVRSSMAARPSGRGWAAGAPGWTHSRPWSASGSPAKTGDDAPRGWMALHTSWTKPGRVSSSDRHPPPAESSASSTTTEQPGPGQRDGGRQPVGPGPHHDRVRRCHARTLPRGVPGGGDPAGWHHGAGAVAVRGWGSSHERSPTHEVRL